MHSKVWRKAPKRTHLRSTITQGIYRESFLWEISHFIYLNCCMNTNVRTDGVIAGWVSAGHFDRCNRRVVNSIFVMISLRQYTLQIRFTLQQSGTNATFNKHKYERRRGKAKLTGRLLVQPGSVLISLVAREKENPPLILEARASCFCFIELLPALGTM